MKKTILAASVLAIITFLAIMPFIHAVPNNYSGYCGGMMSGFYGGYGSGAMALYWIISILVIILIIAGIYWLFKSSNKK